MKKIKLIVIALSVILISACSKKAYFEFEFDNFYGYFFTENSFSSGKPKAEGLGYSIIQNDIKKIYQKNNSSGFIDNIIIVKKQTNDDIKDFVEKTKSSIKIDGHKTDNIKSMKITCKDNKLDAYYINSKVVGNLNTIFFHHSFLKQDDNIYIVSFATQDESERNTFASDAKNIKCKN